MKALIVMFLVVTNIFACDCQKLNYKHKSEAAIAAMTPTQRIDEMVSEQLYHMPALGDETASTINNYIHKDGVKILPILVEFMNNYDPKLPDCEDRKGMRFAVAAMYASDLDTGVVRLRGINEGKLGIAALDRGMERMREAGFGNDDHKFNSRFRLLSDILKELKGINIRDENIRSTLRVRYNVKMNDDEMLELSDFLTTLDPTYTSWSKETEYGPPATIVKFERYYEAYLKFKEFKAKKSGSEVIK